MHDASPQRSGCRAAGWGECRRARDRGGRCKCRAPISRSVPSLPPHLSFRSCHDVRQARLDTYTRRPTCITSSSAPTAGASAWSAATNKVQWRRQHVGGRGRRAAGDRPGRRRSVQGGVRAAMARSGCRCCRLARWRGVGALQRRGSPDNKVQHVQSGARGAPTLPWRAAMASSCAIHAAPAPERCPAHQTCCSSGNQAPDASGLLLPPPVVVCVSTMQGALGEPLGGVLQSVLGLARASVGPGVSSGAPITAPAAHTPHPGRIQEHGAQELLSAPVATALSPKPQSSRLGAAPAARHRCE